MATSSLVRCIEHHASFNSVQQHDIYHSLSFNNIHHRSWTFNNNGHHPTTFITGDTCSARGHVGCWSGALPVGVLRLWMTISSTPSYLSNVNQQQIWYDMIWYDMTWHEMLWYDMIWWICRILLDSHGRCLVLQQLGLWIDVAWNGSSPNAAGNGLWPLGCERCWQDDVLQIDVRPGCCGIGWKWIFPSYCNVIESQTYT